MSTGEKRQEVENDDTESIRPLWIDGCFSVGGVLCDWYCAFEWFAGRNSFFSRPVLYTTGVIVVLCAGISFLAARLVGRRLQESASMFFLVSVLLLGNMLMWWTNHR